ncbi:MAG: LacI family transcriptional regulator [Acidipropionibacterium sp.]|nr:LacI family transcriptional regulator [Acidipropionibacterium sp.]
MTQVTLRDVARAAGVSMATASRVLNGSARTPGAEIGQRVRAAAQQLGYVPNASAQALARSSSGLLGLLVQDLENPYFAAIASGFQRAAAADGRLVLMAQTGGERVTTIAALRSLKAQRADGVLMIGSLNLGLAQRAELHDLLAELQDGGARIVSIAQDFGVGRVLAPDDRAGGAALAQAAVASGYRRLAVLEDTSRSPSAVARAEGFTAGAAGAGVGIEHRVRGSVAVTSGRDLGTAVLDLVRGGTPADRAAAGRLCFFAITDAIALAVLGRALQSGVRVPEELGILGFDGIAAGRESCPSLTTVDLPLREMGRHAYRMLRTPVGTELLEGPVLSEGLGPLGGTEPLGSTEPPGWRVEGSTVLAPGRFRRGGTTLRPSR